VLTVHKENKKNEAVADNDDREDDDTPEEAEDEA